MSSYNLWISPPAGLIWVGDLGSEDFPPYLGGNLIESTPSVVMFAGRFPSQGPTKLLICNREEDLESEAPLVLGWTGRLHLSTGVLAVNTLDEPPYATLTTPGDTLVQVWTDGAVDPATVGVVASPPDGGGWILTELGRSVEASGG